MPRKPKSDDLPDEENEAVEGDEGEAEESPKADSASHGAAAMAGKVMAYRCGKCSQYVETEHAWNRPPEEATFTCQACGHTTRWSAPITVEPRPKPEAEAIQATQGEATARGVAGGPQRLRRRTESAAEAFGKPEFEPAAKVEAEAAEKAGQAEQSDQPEQVDDDQPAPADRAAE